MAAMSSPSCIKPYGCDCKPDPAGASAPSNITLERLQPCGSFQGLTHTLVFDPQR